MRKLSILVAMLICCGTLASGANLIVFEGGTKEAIADLGAPACADIVNITIPAECHILKATVDVASELAGGTYPEGVSVMLNGTTLWEFNGTGYGAFGMQDEFLDGMNDWRSGFGANGGTNSTNIRLPKDAVVHNATIEINCSGHEAIEYYRTFSGLAGNDWFGTSVSCVGDMNNDGYDDMIVGAYGNDAGGTNAGRAYIYLGGTNMNYSSDVILTGAAAGDWFGWSVSGAGDVNNDGYNDVIVGARNNDAGGTDAGRAYIHYGGPTINSTADVILTGAALGDRFGNSVSGAGDVNNDGFDDVVVGAWANDAGGTDAGRAYIYYGGPSMDSTADVILTGAIAGDYFGYSVSGTGDVNGDGFDDVVVGASTNDAAGTDVGRAYIYYGGASMNYDADVILSGTADYDNFGSSVSGAGDVNKDGYNDVVVGASSNDAGGIDAGRAYIYYGGAGMDIIADVTLTGTAAGDWFGASVSGAGDVNKDGYEDVIVGAPTNDAAGTDAGRAYIYYGGSGMDSFADEILTGVAETSFFGFSVSDAGDVDKDGCDDVVVGAHNDGYGKAYVIRSCLGIKEAAASIGLISVWNDPWYFNGTDLSRDFGQELDQLVRNSPSSGRDKYGNSFLDLRILVSGTSSGNLTLSKPRIIYLFESTVPDFSDKLNSYLYTHKAEKNSDGNITVQLTVRSRTSGKLMLENLNISIDEPPRLISPIPDFVMDEDTVAPNLINLNDYFKDEYESNTMLKFSIAMLTNNSTVKAKVIDNLYVSVDASDGMQNDNWTGTIEMKVRATDRWNLTTSSNSFTVSINNIPDPPAFTSAPPLTAVPNQEYSYQSAAVDGDGDALTFGLGHYPSNMTINSSTGKLVWLPRVPKGQYPVSVTVTDGMFTTYQNYSISGPNAPPKVINTTVPDAFLEMRYSYFVPGEDDNGDVLSYSVAMLLTGMAIDSTTGQLIWTPNQVGTFPISVLVSDGIETIVYDFNIIVKEANHAPKVTSRPILIAHLDGAYTYNLTATDQDNDILSYNLSSGPLGMTLDGSTGKLSWTPTIIGNFTVKIEVLDGKGGVDRQDFIINVTAAIRPVVNILSPLSNNWKGVVTITGSVAKGTREVSRVQICIDSGDWKDAAGTYSWSYPLDTATLGEGKHNISVRAFDGKEYSDSFSEIVTVSTKTTTEAFPWFLLLAVLILAVAGVGGYVLYRRRTKGAPPEDYEDQKETREMKESGAKQTSMTSGSLTQVPGIPATAAIAPEGFAIDDLFLMYRDGRLILHTTRRIKADMDVAIVAGMLSALQDFVKESMGREKGAELGSMEYGGNKIMLEKGKYVFIAAVITGGEPTGFRDEMKNVVTNIESEFGTVLPTWDGTVRQLADARRFMTQLGAYKAAPEGLAERPIGAVSLKGELEFYQGFVRLKVAVKNGMPTTITRVSFTLDYDGKALRLDSVEPNFERKGEQVILGIVDPGEKKTMALYLDPQICTETQLEGVLTYKDAQGNFETVKFPRKLASVVCPILFTDENINTAMLKRMAVEELDKKDTKVFIVPASIPIEKAFDIAKAAVQHHDVKLVREFSESQPFIGEAWYYGKAKGREGKLVIRTRVLGEKSLLEFFVASNSTLMLTGMLAELKSDLNKELAAQRGAPEMKQVTAPEEVEAIRTLATFLEKETAENTGLANK